MDKQHVKGAVDKAKGAIKEAAGAATGSTKLKVEGKLDKAKGAARWPPATPRMRFARKPSERNTK